MNKKRYQEEYEEGSNLLWPSEEEDKIAIAAITVRILFLLMKSILDIDN